MSFLNPEEVDNIVSINFVNDNMPQNDELQHSLCIRICVDNICPPYLYIIYIGFRF